MIDVAERQPRTLAATTPSTAERFSIAPSNRPLVVLGLVTLDVICVAVTARDFSITVDVVPDVLVCAALIVSIARIFGFYAAESSADLSRSARGSFALGVTVLPCVFAFAWFDAGRALAFHAALAVASGFAMAVLGRLGGCYLLARFAGRLIERVLIVGKRPPAGWLVGPESLLSERVKIIGQIWIDDDEHRLQKIEPGAPDCNDGVSAISRFDHQRGIDRVVILAADLDDVQLGDIVRSLEALSYPIHIVTDLAEKNSLFGPPRDIGWVLRGAPIAPEAMLAKRSLDILLSALLLVVLAPLMVLIAVSIRLESKGPALFRQVRLGRGNRPFTVFKFRTMRSDAPATDGSQQAFRGDPRITRLGAILRKTSCDELPQLLNVLNGTMSLVGPRPHPTELNRRFMPLIASYAARHRIAPGITGWAQVNGFRGETRTVEQMQRRVELDLEYIRDQSIAFDLWILLRTVVAVFASRNAY